MYDLAIKNGAPVVAMFDSAGAIVYDGAAALAAYGKLLKAVSSASGIIPQIAIISGICGGTSAVAASAFDFVVTVKDKSKLYVNSPFIVGEEVAKSGFAAENGLSSVEAEDENAALGYVKSLLNIIPSNNADGVVCELCTDDINRAIAFDPANYKADELAAIVADNATFVRIYEKYASGAVIGFARVGGIAAGFAISKDGGVIDVKTARAIAKAVSFCDSFGIPFVTLVDSTGLEVSADADGAAYASELSKLALAYANSTNAKVSVVIGKAYGAAFTLLGSKSLGADLAYALEGACISVLSPEASVAFVWNDKVGEKSREELEAEWKEKCASASDAADLGEIDDVIEASELRKRICAALSMLAFKAESAPTRKHAVMPL
jgi:acetyl-CoA carboxylase carboxyltransferase component